MTNNDGVKWSPVARVLKFDPDTVEWARKKLGREPTLADFETLGVPPDDLVEAVGNALTTAGLTRITSLITGAGGAAFTSTLGFAGVGNSSTGFSAAHTNLQGQTAGAWYKGLDGAPSLNAGQISANCTFQSADANFAWNEWCWGIVSSGSVTAANAIASVGTTPIMLNRKVQSLGTKVAGAVWTLQATVTLS